MQQKFLELRTVLARQASDNDAAIALREYFSGFGEITDAYRFPTLESAGNQRCFLICFGSQVDACRAANQLKLRSFAFNGVLVDLGGARPPANDPHPG